MIKRFFIYSLTTAFLPLVCYSHIFAETTEVIMQESVEKQGSRMDCYFDSISDGDRENLAAQLDSLFQVLVEEGQELYRDLALVCKNENIELESNEQAIELMKESPSGQRILQACRNIFSCLHASSEELNDENLSFDVLLQKLDEIANIWRYYRHSKDMEYAYKDLEMREKELDFKKDLLAWQKEKTDKELAWKRERYARDMVMHKG
ncbi:hypothetical protein SBV42_00435 [Chlamydia crocodili]|uniref:Uncharacterized protein n=1 Tax=Chlamydia crocodili TaxID=2766982 RepID=A0ABX8CE90_9CHLA|nr:hypothetical protein [Chlamydia crocodili]QVE49237.1 hypothetical protein H9Q19_00805 [Chlamydia crocodili]